MSRGPGRLQRSLLERLQETPEGRLSRQDLAEYFVRQSGHSCSNVLRAIRGLERMHLVHLHDVPDLTEAFVSLPRPAERLSEDFIFGLLQNTEGQS